MAEKFLILLSPAKNLADKPTSRGTCTTPLFINEIITLTDTLKDYSMGDIAELMKLSTKLAKLNYDRFQNFDPEHFLEDNASQALLTFNGHAYETLDAKSLSDKAFHYLETHLYILSGLYGLLRTHDFMQPYRLEMKTPLETPGCVNLYEFWKETLTNTINQLAKEHGFTHVLNCASQEYAGAVDFTALNIPTITCQFKQKKNDQYKSIGIYSKKARGLMVRYLAEKQAKTLKMLQSFNSDGYRFDSEQSTNEHYIYLKD